MKAASLHTIQKELVTLPPKKVVDICLRLAKHKKENKELLDYLLFEANDEKTFIKNVKEEVISQFGDMNKSNLYLAKKSIRKILRTINKYIRYSGLKETEVELRIHYCQNLKASGIPIHKSQVLINLYENQLKKINVAVSKLHEDLQFDYRREIKELEVMEKKKSLLSILK